MAPHSPRDQFPLTNARVARRWRKLLDERLKDLGVTQARWFTMVCLQRGGGGLTQRELARLMTIENPTLVRLLDSLEQKHQSGHLCQAPASRAPLPRSAERGVETPKTPGKGRRKTDPFPEIAGQETRATS